MAFTLFEKMSSHYSLTNAASVMLIPIHCDIKNAWEILPMAPKSALHTSEIQQLDSRSFGLKF